MSQFMQKSFYIQLFVHVSVKFNQKLTGAIRFAHNTTITINMFAPQSTMKNIQINLMSWKKLIQKPRGNILTEEFRITISRMLNVRHEPQCRNQMNEETKISLSVVVILRTNIHLPNQHFQATIHAAQSIADHNEHLWRETSTTNFYTLHQSFCQRNNEPNEIHWRS